MSSWFFSPEMLQAKKKKKKSRKTRQVTLVPVIEEGDQLTKHNGMRDVARDAFGADGVVTQTAEMIPGVSDVVACIHKFRGENAAAERARARSLYKYLTKDGALTRAATLLPGSNLLAAVCLESTGNHEEAKKALDIVQNWRDAGSADGALTRLAEMFPGTDLVAFALHAEHGEFAHAIRSLVKTRWVEVDCEGVSVVAHTGTVDAMKLAKVVVGHMVIEPVSDVLWGAYMDLLNKLVQKATEADPLADSSLNREDMSGKVVHIANDFITKALDTQVNDLDKNVKKALQGLQPKLAKMRSNFIMRAMIPEAIPPPRTDLIELMQDVVEKVSLTHGPMPKAKNMRPKYTQYRAGLPEVVGATSCLSFLGCVGLGLPIGTFGCLTGCLAGALQGVRKASTQLVPYLNSSNADAEKKMARPPVDPYRPADRKRRRAAQEPEDEQEWPQGVCVEVPYMPEVVKLVTQYVMEDVLPGCSAG